MIEIIHGDCTAVLQFYPDNTFDSCVTDPPYNLDSIKQRYGSATAAPPRVKQTGVYARQSRGFMGHKWDNEIAFDPATWAEVWRVLKPGAHLAAFGGPRTFHRMACAIEDAGFEIRDTIMWVYGSGFPKSHNQSGEWAGWGTALKPAWEPIILARKPLDGTVAGNLDRWGVGAINIGGCRIEANDGRSRARPPRTPNTILGGGKGTNLTASPHNAAGRWPANLIHDGHPDVLECFPSEAGAAAPASGPTQSGFSKSGSMAGAFKGMGDKPAKFHADKGSAARFFYCAKASRSDRNDGLAAFAEKPLLWSSGTQNPGSFQAAGTQNPGSFQAAGTQNPGSFQAAGTKKAAQNPHPTVKPTELMRYLCRLITPPGGRVLDPFTGSGSTGRGAVLEGFDFTGVELTEEYVPIARARIAAVTPAVGVFA